MRILVGRRRWPPLFVASGAGDVAARRWSRWSSRSTHRRSRPRSSESRVLTARVKARRLDLASPTSAGYVRSLATAQRPLAARITTTIPRRERHLALPGRPDGLAVYLPRADLARLAATPGVAQGLAERHLPAAARPQPAADRRAADVGQPTFSTAGNGIKIGIVDDGVDQAHPFFNPAGYTMPPGFPKGDTAFTTAEGDRRARVLAADEHLEVREAPVRPGAVRARDPRRRDRGRQLLARRDRRPRAALRRRPARVSRQLQGADRPDRRTSA